MAARLVFTFDGALDGVTAREERYATADDAAWALVAAYQALRDDGWEPRVAREGPDRRILARLPRRAWVEVRLVLDPPTDAEDPST